MGERRSIVASAVLLMLVWWVAPAEPIRAAPAVRAAQPSSGTLSSPKAVLEKYCISCHNQRVRTGGLALDTLDVQQVSGHAEVWERVIQKLRKGTMPPAGRPRPDHQTYDAVASWLESEIDRSAAANPNPGRSETFHRLNRFEYQAVVRDLLAIDIDVAALLPSDNTYEEGFDNNAEQLSISPALLERYLAAARKISRLAVGIPPTGPSVDTYRLHVNLIQDDRLTEDLPFGSRGGLAIQHHFPVDGEYRIKVKLQAQYNDYIRGMGRPHDLDARLDGVLIKRFRVGGEAKTKAAPEGYAGNIMMDPEWEDYMHHADDNLEVTFDAKAGLRTVAVSFVRQMTETEGVLQPRQTSYALATEQRSFGNAAVDRVAISGPHKSFGPGDTPSRRKIFVCRPSPAATDQACAREILSRLARSAYRRPATEQQLQTLLSFYKAGRSEGSFETGIQFGLERLLADPNFLFRIERDPAKSSNGIYRLTDLELASRLSSFLWSSIPDDELLDVATRGRLSQPSVLEQQVRRLLADGRSKKTLVTNFAAQWLQLRNLRDVTPDPDVFPEFDENLRWAFERETELFLESTLREDRSVVELLSANYTFVNEQLARHYGIPNVYGNHFRRVTFNSDDPRGGLLGAGSVLTVTSYPERTSPVLRGKWLLQNVVGASPPQPPPNVPALPDRGEGGKAASVRERLERHRKNPVCASCHAPMDPLGFALENFDAIGKWRTSEAADEIDASAEMPSGARFDGPLGLKALLLSQREHFVGTVTEKLLAFALSRGLEHYDRPAVRKIVRDTASSDHRWSAIIVAIVKSTPFGMRKVRSEPLAPTDKGLAHRLLPIRVPSTGR
jgi:mono/diheme cytochrome c family protein